MDDYCATCIDREDCHVLTDDSLGDAVFIAWCVQDHEDRDSAETARRPDGTF